MNLPDEIAATRLALEVAIECAQHFERELTVTERDSMLRLETLRDLDKSRNCVEAFQARLRELIADEAEQNAQTETPETSPTAPRH